MSVIRITKCRLATLAFLGIMTTAAPVYAQLISLMPLENPNTAPYPIYLREACDALLYGGWPTIAPQTAFLGGADWAVDRLTDVEQQRCFASMRAMGIKIGLEVGALKQGCQSASACWDGQQGEFNKILANGGDGLSGAFFLDEPLFAVLNGSVPGDFNYALNETRTYIQLIRQTFPGALVIEIEPYPGFPRIPFATLSSWIDGLSAPGPGRPDYFELDVDMNDGSRSMSEIQYFRNHTYGVGLQFALLYAYQSQSYGGDLAFYYGTNDECSYFFSGGISASLYHVSAFGTSPSSTAGEYPYSFMGAVRNLLNRGCIAGTPRYPQAHTVRFRASNGQYVVAENSGGGQINANRDDPADWETFTLYDVNGGPLEAGDLVQVVTSSGWYFRAPGSGGDGLDAAGAYNDYPSWVSFIIVRPGSSHIDSGDSINMQTINGHYWVAENGGGDIVNANRPSAGPWETFTIFLW